MRDPWSASTYGTGALDWSLNLGWHDDAACASVGSELFFASEPGETEPSKLAKRICLGSEKHGIEPCPVQQRCLEHAVETNEAFGIWGGKSPRQRQNIRADQRRANGGRVRCRTCRRLYVASVGQQDCSEECRLVSRRRRDRERSA